MTDKLQILDVAVLDVLKVDVGAESLPVLVNSLISEIRSGEARLVEYLNIDDAALLENQAHALKSATLSFGAVKLGDICLRLEDCAKGILNKREAEGLMDEFKKAASQTITAFEGFLEN